MHIHEPCYFTRGVVVFFLEIRFRGLHGEVFNASLRDFLPVFPTQKLKKHYQKE